MLDLDRSRAVAVRVSNDMVLVYGGRSEHV